MKRVPSIVIPSIAVIYLLSAAFFFESNLFAMIAAAVTVVAIAYQVARRKLWLHGSAKQRRVEEAELSSLLLMRVTACLGLPTAIAIPFSLPFAFTLGCGAFASIIFDWAVDVVTDIKEFRLQLRADRATRDEHTRAVTVAQSQLAA